LGYNSYIVAGGVQTITLVSISILENKENIVDVQSRLDGPVTGILENSVANNREPSTDSADVVNAVDSPIVRQI
jgi:hypothetical protein